MPANSRFNLLFYSIFDLTHALKQGQADEFAQISKKEFKEFLSREVARIQHDTVQNLTTVKSSKRFQTYLVGLKKATLIALEGLNHPSLKNTFPRIDCRKSLLELYVFLYEHFPHYRLPSDTIPIKYFLNQKQEINEVITQVKNWPYRYNELIWVQYLLKPLESFTEKDRMPTCLKYEYTKAVCKVLKRLVPIVNETKFEAKLIELIFYVNLNTPKVFMTLTDWYEDRLNSLGTQEDKLLFLLAEQKNLSSFPRLGKLAFKPAHNSIYHQIDSWLHAQITFIEAERRLSEKQDAQKTNTSTRLAGFEKLSLKLSVSEIAAFIKSLNDADLITGGNVTHALKWTSQTMSSKRQADISFESLRSKYYDIPFSTKEKTVENLRKALKSVHNS